MNHATFSSGIPRTASLEIRPHGLDLKEAVDLAVDDANLSAAGTRGNPGMVRMSPISTTTKPAPARRRTSRILGTWPLGAPMREGSSENEYWVLATHTGRRPQPAASSSSNFALTDPSAAMSAAP